MNDTEIVLFMCVTQGSPVIVFCSLYHLADSRYDATQHE